MKSKKSMENKKDNTEQEEHETQEEQCRTQYMQNEQGFFICLATQPIQWLFCVVGENGVYSSHESSIFYVPSQTPAEKRRKEPSG